MSERSTPARRAPAFLFGVAGVVAAALVAGAAAGAAAGLAPVLAALAPRPALGAPPAGEETRAIWVVRHAITTPGRVDQIVKIASDLNMNTLLVQVRGRGDAYYDSDLSPRAEDLGGSPNDFDPLYRIIARAHAAGIEVHAWINVFLVWSAGQPPASPLHVVNSHPDWIAMRSDGQSLVEMLPEDFENQRLEGMYLAPGNPEVRSYIRDIVREIVTKYNVDGIHLDYIRYPEPNVGFDPASRTTFEREFGVDPIEIEAPDSTFLQVFGADKIPDLRARWNQWKRDQITNLVRDLKNDLVQMGHGTKLTAAVIADQQAALNRYGQDWPRWLREGLIDAAVPMCYGKSTPVVERQLQAAMSLPTQRQVWAGIAIYNQGARDAVAKIRKARGLGVDGIALFSYDSLLGRAGYMRQLKTWAFREPTAPTAMPWRKP